MHVVFFGFEGVRPVSQDTVFHYDAVEGVSRKFKIQVEYFSTPATFVVAHRGHMPLTFTRYLLNARTGEYGSLEEIRENPPLEYRFNPESRCFEAKVVNFEKNRWQKNRDIIETVRSIIPQISDSMALVLYSDQGKVTRPWYVSTWQGMVMHLLKNGYMQCSNETERERFLDQLRLKTEAKNRDILRMRREAAERRKRAERVRWLLSWLIPLTILVTLLAILLILRRRISSRVVTSHRADRVITYLVYLLAIGIALYFAWPYLGITGE